MPTILTAGAVTVSNATTVFVSPPWYLTSETTTSTATILTVPDWLQTPSITTTSTDSWLPVPEWLPSSAPAWLRPTRSEAARAAAMRLAMERELQIVRARVAERGDMPEPFHIDRSLREQAHDADVRRRRAQANSEYAGIRAAQNAARDKARQLLLSQLSDRQRIDLASNGYFELETLQPSGERRRYRIRRGRARNVDRIDAEGRRLFTLCAHPAIDCPDEDTMLTQKLWLETNEENFLRMANRSL